MITTITIPDEMYIKIKKQNLNVAAICRAALGESLNSLESPKTIESEWLAAYQNLADKAAKDAYLAEHEAEVAEQLRIAKHKAELQNKWRELVKEGRTEEAHQVWEILMRGEFNAKKNG